MWMLSGKIRVLYFREKIFIFKKMFIFFCFFVNGMDGIKASKHIEQRKNRLVKRL